MEFSVYPRLKRRHGCFFSHIGKNELENDGQALSPQAELDLALSRYSRVLE